MGIKAIRQLIEAVPVVHRLGRQLKRTGRLVAGRDCIFRYADDIPIKKVFGSVYGGWCIAPNHLRTKPSVISVGIGDDISFDVSMSNEFSAEVFAFDPSPNVKYWLSEQQLPSGFSFEACGLAAADGTQDVFPVQGNESMLR